MFGVSKKTEFRVMVTGLPKSASWQDLKDHMRKAGDVTYADVSFAKSCFPKSSSTEWCR